MYFQQLLAEAGVTVLARKGLADVRQVLADSRRVGAGSCFVAIRGSAADGHQYISTAVQAGASAVVCEDPAAVPEGVAWAQVPSCAAAAGPLAQAMLGWPARKLTIIAATGTKGKTTFTYLVRHILRSRKCTTGVIGTIAYEFGDRSIPAPNTTPGAIDLAEMTAEMVRQGVTHLVMEVSSHALDQHRVGGLNFAAAAFTNLSGDHLDYHHTMEEYLAAKGKLFDSLAPDATAVLNQDDPASQSIASRTPGRVLWYGLNPAAELSARIVRGDSAGTGYELCYQGRCVNVASHMIGRHNVANSLAAAGCCLSLGVPLEAVAAALGEPIQVPGRLQRVPSRAPFEVVVDYAHTDDSLENALSSLRPLTRGRLIVMFGCGGDRDRTKRPRMARVAQERADEIVLTSDNPRTEDPQRILDEILTGFDESGRGRLHVEPDRRQAIALAIGRAQAGDVVVLAGKGHEDYQIIGATKHHFDDAEIAAGLLDERFGPQKEGRQ